MNFFQNSVLNKHLKAQNAAAIKAAFAEFRSYFHNPVVQQNIREAKEEQFQEGFLRELFVKILGYTLNPSPNFNITTEYKNVKDSKKADGAILINGVVKAVIELKGTDTTDLNRIETQAFGYKNNQPECVYVITSNFEKLRFYIDNAIENIEFNLFTLTEKEFELLWLCLAYTNIEKNIPKRIKDESVSQEDVITKNLYNDYSLFKRELHQTLVAHNPQYDALTLFRKSQKLLDRFLFLFFAEDRQLLPPNSVRLILDDWRDLQDRDVQIPLYERFKKYFEYLNTGFKGKRYDVFAYNGGLFKTDELLDGLKIDDELLYRHALKLSEYDFVSEVDVNILGHIFENSLNELDEIKAQLEGQQVDKTKSKRKKDGVFYTPKYITKYIVDNTVGKLCTEKKAEIQLIDEEYITDRKRQTKTIQTLFDKLTTYRNWLLQLTICDPACGSGAFLNQALDFLINEHRYIDELQAKLFGDAMVLSDNEKSILENNLFGVDINEESVEIAKLSLWLRTAQPNRKLNDLNNNIKCGNSLIDDPAVAGDKAFNWHKEFPAVFAKGGFDVVIGNPPYGAKLELDTQKYLNEKYIIGGSETAISFTKLSFDSLLKTKGIFGFIIPKAFTFSSNYEGIRKCIYNDLFEIIDCKKVWKEVLLEQIILFFKKNSKTDFYNSGRLIGQQIQVISEINKQHFQTFGFYLNDISGNELNIGLKVKNSNIHLGDISTNSRGGIFQNKISKLGNIDVLGGAEIQRFGIVGIKGKIEKEVIIGDVKCFINDNSILVQNLVAHIENPVDHIKITACLPINKDFAIVDTINQITFNEGYNHKVLWLILNSKLINWYCYRFIFARAIRTMHFDNSVTNRIPIPESFNFEVQVPLIRKADQMLSLNKELRETSGKFQRILQRKFNLEELPGKLQNWYLLTYDEFIKELAKKKVKLSLKEEAEWEAYFLEEAAQALAIKAEIEKTDQEIDRMVYALYGLSEEEIKIVEGK
ncbi:MAG: type I restriction-modification system methyltransferase subunit [Bacteroidetes bacterium]|nr:MAG: type I restriction-modification system methyltransferase subunit [Bacteroidota bacterium]